MLQLHSLLLILPRRRRPIKSVGIISVIKPLTSLSNYCVPLQFYRAPTFRPFILQTDASDRGVGAVLTQRDGHGEEHPVSYYSRKLLPREQRYSTVEKELLAIKLATNAFRVYLLGRPFLIVTDHRSLEWQERLKENNARLTRWSLALQPYDFIVQHRPGKDKAMPMHFLESRQTSLSLEKGEEYEQLVYCILCLNGFCRVENSFCVFLY